MVVEVHFDLFLGLRNEAEAVTVTAGGGCESDRYAPDVPKRHEPTAAAAQLVESLLAPGEMIEFLTSRCLEMTSRGVGIGDERLSRIQSLRGDLTRMVDAHQRYALRSISVGELDLVDVRGGRRPLRHCRTEARRETLLNDVDEAIRPVSR